MTGVEVVQKKRGPAAQEEREKIRRMKDLRKEYEGYFFNANDYWVTTNDYLCTILLYVMDIKKRLDKLEQRDTNG